MAYLMWYLDVEAKNAKPQHPLYSRKGWQFMLLGLKSSFLASSEEQLSPDRLSIFSILLELIIKNKKKLDSVFCFFQIRKP